MNPTRLRRALPLAILVAGMVAAGAGCNSKGEEPKPPQPPSEQPPAAAPEAPLDRHEQTTETVVSPDGKWKVVIRSGPEESFDLIGQNYRQTIQHANGLEFAPDSKYFIYMQDLPGYDFSALFAFDTTERSHRCKFF